MTIPLSGKDWQTINRDPEMTVIATAEMGSRRSIAFVNTSRM